MILKRLIIFLRKLDSTLYEKFIDSLLPLDKEDV